MSHGDGGHSGVCVVVAPDSFKGTITAAGAARALAAGWHEVRPGDEVVECPQADGGEGTLEALARAVPGAALRTVRGVTGPDLRPVDAHWLALPDGGAVAELAEPAGIALMAGLDPLGATTAGLGQVLAAALDAGATSLTIGLGGSASTDGGTGALAALGLRLLDDAGRELPPGGGALTRLARIDATGLRRPPAGGVRLLSDVTAPLLGPAGAAVVFGPQKGAGPGEIDRLERGLARLAELLGGKPDEPGAGAAGGTGYGFAAAWGATVVPGADEVARLTGLTGMLADRSAPVDLVVLGEGRFDATSLTGKVVGHGLALAAERGVPAAVVAGLVADPGTLDDRGATHVDLTDLAGDGEAARADPARWLAEAGRRLAGGRQRAGA